jgi:hypothetical protein
MVVSGTGAVLRVMSRALAAGQRYRIELMGEQDSGGRWSIFKVRPCILVAEPASRCLRRIWPQDLERIT